MLSNNACWMIRPTMSIQAVKIAVKCKYLSDFPTVTLWIVWKNMYFFCPYPCVSANGVTIHHTVTVVYVHMSVTVLHNGWFQSISILITDISFCWTMMHICHYVHVSFVFSCYNCQVMFHHSLYIAPFQSEFSSKVTRHSFLTWSDSITAIYGLCMYIIK
jgi:hypothetical protein